MSNIWDKKYIENHTLKEGQELRIPSYARMFYKDVMKQYEISPEKEETLNKVNLLGQKYGVYIWYSKKAKELLDCYEIIEAMEESLKYNQDKIKELDYKIDQATRSEEWTQKFNDLVNGKTFIETSDDFGKWICKYHKDYDKFKGKETTKDQLELKRKEIISNAIKISEYYKKISKIEDANKKYLYNTKIKSLEAKNQKMFETIETKIYQTYYANKLQGIKDLRATISEREQEINELDYAYAKETIYRITYSTIKQIMLLEETIKLDV